MDRDALKVIITKKSDALKHFPDEVRDDPEMVLFAVGRRQRKTFRYASARLKGDRDFIMTSLKAGYNVYSGATEAIRNDREMALLAMRHCGEYCFGSAPSQFHGDRELALLAIHREASNLAYSIQRVFILTILQHLSVIQIRYAQLRKDEAKNESDGEKGATIVESPDLILAIEEPELFQHPNRQRHFAKVLLQLAEGTLPGVAEKTQIIYCNHSPLFVGIDRINEIRLLKKVNNSRLPLKSPKLFVQLKKNC